MRSIIKSLFGGARPKSVVEIRPQGIRIELASGETILQAALAQGIAYPHNCTVGTCGSCKILVKEGMENLSPKGIIEKFTLMRMFSSIGHEDEMRLACQCTVSGDCKIVVNPPMNWSGDNFWQKPYPNK